jgi:hypothetical protein
MLRRALWLVAFLAMAIPLGAQSPSDPPPSAPIQDELARRQTEAAEKALPFAERSAVASEAAIGPAVRAAKATEDGLAIAERSARAAEDAAFYAWVALWITGLGTLAVTGALVMNLLTLWAMQQEHRRAEDHFQRTFRPRLRLGHVHSYPRPGSYLLRLELHNDGSTPAASVTVACAATFPTGQQIMQDPPPPADETPSTSVGHIMPGQNIQHFTSVQLEHDELSGEYVVQDGLICNVAIRVTYQDDFEKHYTFVSYVVFSIADDNIEPLLSRGEAPSALKFRKVSRVFVLRAD